MIEYRALWLWLNMVVLGLYGCSNSQSQAPCEKFVLYQERKINLDALKIAVETKKVPVDFNIGTISVDPQTLREAPEKIQSLDMTQFAACQAVYSVPEGPDRIELSKRWATALNGLINALAGTKDPKFNIRLDGKEEGVRASAVKLDLGYIPADTLSEYKLRISGIGDSAQIRAAGNESGVVWKWESSSPVEKVTRGNDSLLLLTIDRPGLVSNKTAIVRLVPEDSANGEVTIAVKYTALASTVTQKESELDKLSGNGSDFSNPYYACVNAPSPGDYAVIPASVVVFLSGDRACKNWSTCDDRIDPGGKRACLVFTLQGHNEGGEKQRKSTGHINAIFALKPSIPSLVANAY